MGWRYERTSGALYTACCMGSGLYMQYIIGATNCVLPPRPPLQTDLAISCYLSELPTHHGWSLPNGSLHVPVSIPVHWCSPSFCRAFSICRLSLFSLWQDHGLGLPRFILASRIIFIWISILAFSPSPLLPLWFAALCLSLQICRPLLKDLHQYNDHWNPPSSYWSHIERLIFPYTKTLFHWSV